MLFADPRNDHFISGFIRQGRHHDPEVGNAIVKTIEDYYVGMLNTTNHEDVPRPVILDVGTNIGYFASIALAAGARAISFEPMRANYGCVMATVRHNNWTDRHSLYINATSFQGATANMRATNDEINNSNGHVTNQTCNDDNDDTSLGQYGLDWMESVSLDQVVLTKHADIHRFHLMKMDIETFEVNAINGAGRFLCNRIVESIIVEVLYLQSQHNLTACNTTGMQNFLEQMGYEIWDTLPTFPNATNVTHQDFDSLPPTVIFVLKDKTRTPWQRLQSENAVLNPCADFQWP